MADKFQFQFDFSSNAKTGRRENVRKRILLLGNYSGQNQDKPELASRKPLIVDVDSLDAVLSKIAPQIRFSLEGGGEETLIDFKTLEHFHPDELYKRLDIFKSLRGMRMRLENPSTFAAAAEELKRGMGEITSETTQDQSQAQNQDENLFDRLLGGHSTESESIPKQPVDKVQSIIQQIVAPHLSKGVDLGQQKQLLSALDDSINQLMRGILHHPQFQALEAAWRGVEWLVGNIEDSDDLKIYLLDVSFDEIMADIGASEGQVEKIAIHRLMSESSLGIPGGEPWSLVVGDFRFGDNVESLVLLELMGAFSAGCGGKFIANGSPQLLGCESLAMTPDKADWSVPKAEIAQVWQSLRKSQAARYIGLALPRFMLRLPYGKNTNPTDNFRFEEMPSKPKHEHYLWGNSALICAEMIARSWLEGEDAEPGTLRDTGSLPYHVYDDGSGQSIKPCAEVYLNEKTANAILDAGIIPVLSVRNQNRAIVPRLMSIAEDATELV